VTRAAAIPEERHISRSPAETHALARRLVERFGLGTVFALHGDLGSGKTCLVQGMGRALRVRETVASPTFTLINEYHGDCPLYHADLYRVAGTAEALALGLDEYLEPDGITVIEWAERAADGLPAETVHVELRAGGAEGEREVRIWRDGGAA